MNLKAEHLDASCSSASLKDKDVIQTWRPEKEEKSFPLCLWIWQWPYRAPWSDSTDNAASDIQLPCRAARSCRRDCERWRRRRSPCAAQETFRRRFSEGRKSWGRRWNKIVQPWNCSHGESLAYDYLKNNNNKAKLQHEVGFMLLSHFTDIIYC